MTPIAEVVADSFRDLLVTIACNGAWCFETNQPAVRMTREFEQAMRFAVRAALEKDGLVRAVAQGQ